MGCGMSSRFKRARASVSVTESTQHEFLTEIGGESGHGSILCTNSGGTSATSRRTKSLGSLFHSRRVQNISENDVTSSGASAKEPSLAESSKSKPERVRSSSWSFSKEKVEDDRLTLPGEAHVDTRSEVTTGVGNLHEGHNLLAIGDGVPTTSSIFTSSGIDAGTSNDSILSSEKNDRVSLDSGFHHHDTGTITMVTFEDRIIEDEDNYKSPDAKEDTTTQSGGEKEDEIHGNHGNKSTLFINEKCAHKIAHRDTENKEAIQSDTTKGKLSCSTHKDSGIEIEEAPIVDAEPQHFNNHDNSAVSSGSKNIIGRTKQHEKEGAGKTPSCKHHKQIGIKTLEQIVEVGRMISNPVDHLVLYESPQQPPVVNGDTRLPTAIVLSDVADDESYGAGVAKATVSSLEQPLIEGDNLDEELWPGMVMVQVHQDFFNDFDDCFDDDELMTAIDLK